VEGGDQIWSRKSVTFLNGPSVTSCSILTIQSTTTIV